MTDLFERVLLPIAGDEDARTSARALRAHLDAADSVVAVTVVEKAGGGIDKASVEQRELDAEDAFDVVSGELADTTSVETSIEYGTDVAEAIFAAADEADATSIVFTPRGGSRWLRLLTGDVALDLVTESDRPVVVLPGDDQADSDGTASESTPGADTDTDE